MGLFGFGENKKQETVEEPQVTEKVEEPEMPEKEEEKTYDLELKCTNCNDESTYEISFGQTLEDYAKDRICENCGCKTLSRPEEDD